jgi:small conductance mechanosensitive channel
MDDIEIPGSNVDWAGLWAQTQTVGVDFAIKAVVAVLIFYVGRIIARMLTNATRRLLQSQEVDKILETFVSNLVYWVLMTFVIIAAINQIGVQTTSLIAIMGAAGLAVGLALQGSLANFAAGVLIVMFRPYRVGDFVEAAGIAGSSVNFALRPWVKSADYWGVKFELTEAIKKRFDSEGISFPYPQQDVHIIKEG